MELFFKFWSEIPRTVTMVSLKFGNSSRESDITGKCDWFCEILLNLNFLRDVSSIG